MRKLPIGIQSFEEIRNNDYLYVDKTEYIWNLISTGKTYFLSRPRRFGKSMLISTLEAYFSGKKDLFQGLAIEKYEHEWQKYPVIKFSLAGGAYADEEGLYQVLNQILTKQEKKYGIHSEGIDLPSRFRNLIEEMYHQTGKQIVILVDEYDKPLLDNVEVNSVQEEKNRQLYSSFFSVLKDEDAYIKFSFITGVTKFAKVSIFSGLNQPRDISLSSDYARICGITQAELNETFQPEIQRMAEDNGITFEECLEMLKDMYDGYHFAKRGDGVYNPFSLLNAFSDREFGSYWYSTGTPTFLVHKLENSSYTAEQFTDGVTAKEAEMSDSRADNPNPVPIFYQSGYLTISGYNTRLKSYQLKFPNEEVRYGFYNSLMPSVIGEADTEHYSILDNMVLDLDAGDIDSFMTRLESLFAGIPYIEGKKHSYEQEWRNEVYLILVLIGENVHCEVHTATGRADCVIETEKYVYILELKLDKSVEEALDQINQQGYADSYKADQRKLLKVGINFSSKTRNIDGWKAE